MSITQNGVLQRDDNDTAVMGGTSSVDDQTIIDSAFDPVTRRLLVDLPGGGSGTVTEVDTGTGLTGGPITTTGTISLDSKLAPLDTLGSAGQSIRVNAGTTALEYYTPSTGAPGGSNLQVQYNNAGSFGGISGAITNGTSLQISSGDLLLEGASSGGVTLNAPATGGGTLTLPAGTDTILGAASTATLTNKTFDTAGTGNSFSINSVAVTANTGTGAVARATGPTFTTPTLGIASATTVNKVTVTTPATGSTLTIADGKTLTQSNSLTYTGTDGSSVAFGTGGTVLYSASTIPLTVGTTTIASGTNFRVLMDNSGVLGEYATTGTGTVAMSTSPTFITPTLGAALATSINGNTFTTGSYTLTGTAGKTLTFSNSLTLAGTDSTTMTFPSTSATVGGLGIAQTWTAQDKFNNIIDVNNAVTVTTNAGTVPVTFRLSTFTNSSAAAMTITMATASAVDGQMTIVRIYDFSAVAEGISWVNTENSTITAPATSNGSTTLPLTVGFQFNGATSKWRCIALA